MSKFLRGLGSFIQIAGGLLGFVLSLFFVYFEFGGTGVIIALVIFPATFALVPLYSLFVYGTWNLLLINYGGIAAGIFLHWVADKIDQKTQGRWAAQSMTFAQPSIWQSGSKGAAVIAILYILSVFLSPSSTGDMIGRLTIGLAVTYLFWWMVFAFLVWVWRKLKGSSGTKTTSEQPVMAVLQENLDLRQSHDEPALTPLMKAPKAGNPASRASLPVILLVIAGLILIVIASAISQSSSTLPSTSTLRATKASPTKTPLPRSTRTPRPVSIQACVTNSTVRIRKGPGTEYEAIGGMVSGTCMSIQGRDKDSSWVYMVSEDGKTGWVAASLLTIEGNLSRVSLKSNTGDLSLAPTSKTIPTSTRKPVVVSTNTSQPLLSRFTMLCSDAGVGERVSCQIPRAYCDYRPDVDGSPTFCNDKPYPNQGFTLVVFGEDWGDFNGSCIIVSGYVERYGDHLQIQATSRSQVSYCD